MVTVLTLFAMVAGWPFGAVFGPWWWSALCDSTLWSRCNHRGFLGHGWGYDSIWNR
jgi:hypothetical protein